MHNVTFIETKDFSKMGEPICPSDTQEIVDAIKNDKPIPVSREQFELIDRLTKLMLDSIF